ncbi:MAG: L-threonylcarbamoyladenylate synthase [Candidatus Paceibacterota bacterium]|jgi:L-threonylcarbamoyladenylate synthase
MKNEKEIAHILKTGGVGVIPTDTLYGLVAQALDKKAVTRVRRLKSRGPSKPFIILISSIRDLEKFKIKLDPESKKILTKIWPGPVSVAFNKKLSFRLPKNKFLNELIKKTGPLIAPSANPEGSPPASTISDARNYFGTKIDFYLSNGKKLAGQPSTLISLKKGQIEILRYGKYKLRGI